MSISRRSAAEFPSSSASTISKALEISRVGDALVKSNELPEEQLRNAVNIASVSIARQKASVIERDVAMEIKQYFDTKYGGVWHCIVGKSFGSFVSHQTGGFCYFIIDKYAVLLFKS
jgi:dynein light chain LC8-type